MLSIKFEPIDRFSFFCFVNGDCIGKVFYSPCVYFSWVFSNLLGDVQTYGSTKIQAVRFYLSNFAAPFRTFSENPGEKTPQPPSPETEATTEEKGALLPSLSWDPPGHGAV